MADNKIEDSVKTVAEVMSGVLEKAPIYEDLAQPGLKQIGEGLGGMLQLAMLPLKMMGYKADDFLNKFKESLEKKGKLISESNLQSPDPIVGGQIMHALGYTSHESELREMFTNLLSSAMNLQRSDEVHPAFPDIIKQIAPHEAITLRNMLKSIKISSEIKDGSLTKVEIQSVTQFPICSLVVEDSLTLNTKQITRNILLLSSFDLTSVYREAKFVDNMIRLGILTVDYSQHFVDVALYDNHELWLSVLEKELPTINLSDTEVYKLRRGILSITRFGGDFFNTRVIDPTRLSVDSLGNASYS